MNLFKVSSKSNLKGFTKKIKSTFLVYLFSSLGLPWLILKPTAVSARTATYEDTSGGTINTRRCISREFEVSENFAIRDVNLGFNASHPSRGNIRVRLFHPDGTTVTVINPVNQAVPDYDLFIDNLATNSPYSFNNNTSQPYYDRAATPSNPLSAFDGKPANGTWTIQICNFSFDDAGTYNRSILVLNDTIPVVDTPAEANLDYKNGCTANTKIAVILDASGSVSNAEAQATREATQLLIDEFADTGTEVGIVEFAQIAKLQIPFTPVNSGSITNTFDPYLNDTYPERNAIGGFTNWEAALQETYDRLTDADAVIFITDGNPNTYLNEDIGNTPVTDSDNASVPVNESVRPANLIKANRTHIYAFGITNGVSIETLEKVAEGDESVQFNGSNAVVADYDFVNTFDAASLGSSLVNLARGICATGLKDYGDLPADGQSAPDGSTTSYGDASHVITNGIQLGTSIDAETSAQNSENADGDGADDDGVTIPSLIAGQTTEVTVDVVGAGGYLQGWIDWNGDGSFDANEQVAENLQDNSTNDTDDTTGKITFEVDVPVDAITTANTFGRFRWSTVEDLNASDTTAANDGEVEDYQIAIAPAPVCPTVKADLWFANDESASVDPDEFEDALDFIYQVSDSFVYGRTRNIQAGIIGWAREPLQTDPNHIIIPITDTFGDRDDSGLISAGTIDVDGDGLGIRERYTSKVDSSGGTRLDLATDYLATLIENGNGRRENTPQIAVILTDAFDEQILDRGTEWMKAARRLRMAGPEGTTIVLVLIDAAQEAYNNSNNVKSIVDRVVGSGGLETVASYTNAAQSTEKRIQDVSQTICDSSIPRASDPKMLLVKRITAINPDEPDGIRYDNFVNDPNSTEDNDFLWPDPNLYLRGEIKPSIKVKSGDVIEYTIYFLSSGDDPAEQVKICDVMPDSLSYLPDTYARERGIALKYGTELQSNPIELLTNFVDDDAGTFVRAGEDLPPDLCKQTDAEGNLVTVNDNTNGAVIFTPQTSLPPVITPGEPASSYGFIRFQVRVK